MIVRSFILEVTFSFKLLSQLKTTSVPGGDLLALSALIVMAAVFCILHC